MKRLPITDQIKADMQAALGDLPDLNAIAVFETVAADSQPLRQRGSLYENAVMTPSFLQELAASITPGNTVPFIALHKQKDMLPVGRVFKAQLVDGAVRAQFFVNDPQLANSIDNSVVDSVSIGAAPQHLNCSECGWDYLGADASILNVMDRTCANGHTIGTDGVHVNLNGLYSWMELSAVGTGAVQRAKILSRAKAMLTEETRTRLAASGMPAEAHICFATIDQPKGAPEMDLKEFMAQLTAQATEIAQLKASVATLEATKTELTAAQAKVTELTAKVGELEPKAAGNDAVLVFLKEHAKRALVATGKPDEAVPEDPAKLMEVITASQTNLVNLLPEGGRAKPAATSKDTAAGTPPRSAFTNRKLA